MGGLPVANILTLVAEALAGPATNAAWLAMGGIVVALRDLWQHFRAS